MEIKVWDKDLKDCPEKKSVKDLLEGSK